MQFSRIFLQSIPFAYTTLIKQKWIFNTFICKVYWIFTGINSYTSVFFITVLALDRYLLKRKRFGS